jgi:hypothetical protein
MPDTDIWLFKFESLDPVVLSHSLNITARPGYDNQPSFSADGKKIYYSSVREDGQADIYVYEIRKKRTTRLTSDIESQYSPSVVPGSSLLTSVVVEKDSSQRIHFIDPETGLAVKKLNFDSVGYYTFLNKDSLVYYKLTSPHSLRLFIQSTGSEKWIGDSPGRGFKPVDRHTLLYSLKDSSELTIYKYDFLLHKGEKVTSINTRDEELVWLPRWGISKSEGARLMRYDEEKKQWLLVADLSAFGIKRISRFSVFKDRYLVIVDQK